MSVALRPVSWKFEHFSTFYQINPFAIGTKGNDPKVADNHAIMYSESPCSAVVLFFSLNYKLLDLYYDFIHFLSLIYTFEMD